MVFPPELQEIIDGLKKKLEKTLLSKNSHFDLGPKLHINKQFSVKKIFEDSVVSRQIATVLRFQLTQVFADKDLNNTTFVAYGTYCGICMNELCSLLQPDYDTNYVLIEKVDDAFTHFPIHRVKKQVVIVLPLSCRFDLYFSLKKFLEDTFTRTEKQVLILPDFFSIFLILMNDLKKKKIGEAEINISEFGKDAKFLYNYYCWQTIQNNRVLLNGRETNEQALFGHYILNTFAKLQLAESCQDCFPAGDKLIDDLPVKIKHLIPAYLDHGNPDTIFDVYPRFVNRDELPPRLTFGAVFRDKDGDRGVHLAGNLEIQGFKFRDYIRRDVFYEKNSPEILQFFGDQILPFLKNVATNEIIVFVITGNQRLSNFLEDFLNEPVMKDRPVFIIPYSPTKEYLGNFISNYKDKFKTAKRFFFFDEVIAGGVSFKKVSDHLKNTRMSGLPSKTGDEATRHGLGFDAILTLVDRSSVFEKEEILRKLNLPPRGAAQANRVISFFKLNVPSIDATYSGNPITETQDLLKGMLAESRLDALKINLYGSIKKWETRELDYLESNQTDELEHFPFAESEPEFRFYKKRFNYSQKNLIYLEIAHNIGEWFAVYPKKKFEISDLLELIGKLKSEPYLRSYFYIPDKYKSEERNQKLEEDIIEDMIIKVLTNRPFRAFNNICDTVFLYCNQKLQELQTEMSEHVVKTNDRGNVSNEELKNIFLFPTFRRFKFYIKRTVDLDSNFIISYNFLVALRSNIVPERRFIMLNKHEEGQIKDDKNLSDDLKAIKLSNIKYENVQIQTFKFFLLQCYKQLTYMHPSRAIVLEGLINHENLLPDIFHDDQQLPPKDQQSLKDALQDPFYHLGRIIKSENSFILNDLRNQYRKEKSEIIKPEMSEDEALEAIKKNFLELSYQDAYRPRTSHLFISKSKAFGKPEQQEIVDSIAYMLQTSSLIDQANSVHTASPDNNEHFLAEIRKILKSASNILGPGLEYAFCAEYKAVSILDNSSPHVFTVQSRNNDLNVQLNPKGITWNMMNGLVDRGKNVQTFTVFAKENNKVLSFSSEYFSREGEEIHIGAALRADYPLIESDGDENDYSTGFQLFEEAEIILLFRLANITGINKESGGRAVFAICCKEKATKASVREFINVEKLRLLLLIKDDLLEYLQKQIENDAFVDLLSKRAQIAYESRFRHGMRRYLGAQDYYIDHLPTSSEKALLRIVNGAIAEQLNYHSWNVLTNAVEIRYALIVHRIKLILEDPFLGENRISFSEILIDCQAGEYLNFPKVILLTVLPEVLINMKKYHDVKAKDQISIRISDKEIIVSNKISPHYLNPNLKRDPATHGKGRKMCQEIMKKLQRGFWARPTADKQHYEVIINLTKNDQ